MTLNDRGRHEKNETLVLVSVKNSAFTVPALSPVKAFKPVQYRETVLITMGHLWMDCNEIRIKTQQFSFANVVCKM